MRHYKNQFLTVLLLFSILISACSKSARDKNKHVDAVSLSDTLTSKVVPTSAHLWNPRTLETVGSEYLLVFDDIKDGPLIKVFSLPELKFLYGWGEIGHAPNELPRFPSFHSINTKGDTLILLEAPAPGVQHLDYYKVTDTTLQHIDERPLSYEEQRSLINNLRRLNDSLFTTDYGLEVESDKEFIAIEPDSGGGAQFKFGKYPDSDLTGMHRYRVFLKRNVASAKRQRFVAFYMRYDRFKIYNLSGSLVSDIHVHDSLPSRPSEGERGDFVHTMRAEATDPFVFTVVLARRASTVDSKEFSQLHPFLEVWSWSGNQVKRYPLDVSTNAIAVAEQYEKAYTYQIGVDTALYQYDLSRLEW